MSSVPKKWVEDAAVTSYQRSVRGSLRALQTAESIATRKSTFQHAWSRYTLEEQRLKWTIPAYNVQWLNAYRQIPHYTRNERGSLLFHSYPLRLLQGAVMPGADTATYCHWNIIFCHLYMPCHIWPSCNKSSFRRSLINSNLDRF